MINHPLGRDTVLSYGHPGSHKTAICKRCDSFMVAWAQSKDGRWYLINIHKQVPLRGDGDGYYAAALWDGHAKTCGGNKAC